MLEEYATEYRRIKLPRTNVFFSAFWLDEDKLAIFTFLSKQDDMRRLLTMLRAATYEPTIYESSNRLFVEHFGVILYFVAECFDVQSLWASGVIISEEAAQAIHQSIEEPNR